MATTNYFEYVIDPATGQQIEVRDRYAREQLIHKTEKTVVNSLPSKPTDMDEWLAMEKFIYYVPVEGETDKYEAWTLFFIGDPTVASDYTNPDNYQYVQIATTDADLSNFSTKAHTHEVIPETEVEDHLYTPQGEVSGTFTGSQGTTADNGSHTHSVTVPSQTLSGNLSGTAGTTGAGSQHRHSVDFPSVNISGTLSGTAGTTGVGSQHRHSVDFPSVNVSGTLSGEAGTTGVGSQHRHSVDFPSVSVSGTLTGDTGTTGAGSSHTHGVTPTKKKLSTKKLSVSPSTSVNFSGSTTNAQRATGALETLASYDASKAVFNGISVVDGVLSFVTKKMSTADTVSALAATIDASKVTYNNSGTATNEDVATGALADGTDSDPLVLTDVSVNSESAHTHSFTPSGSVSGTTSSTSGNTGYENEHTHSFTPSGTVSGTTTASSGNTGYENEHTHSFTPSGTVTGTTSASSGNTGYENAHTHSFTPSGSVAITTNEQTVDTGSAGTHNHTFTPAGSLLASFQGALAVLKHKVNNKKVRTSPDMEDEGSHAFDWYGIEFDETDTYPIKTRVGNMDMHKMLPIQTKMRRCLLKDDGTVYNYLDSVDSTKYAQGSKDVDGNDISGRIAELKGTARSVYGDNTSAAFDVQVMVEIPEHWRKVYTYTSGSATMVRAMISPYEQTTSGWVHIKKGYVSAYEAAVISNKLCSVSDVKNLSLSVVDGKVNASCDVSSATAQSGITSQLPTTSKTLEGFRTTARARGASGESKWNQLVYEQYLAVCWLYWIEYANLDSQDNFTTALDNNGYHQGGLGNGVTTVTDTNWNTFNSRKPFVPCGITNCLGNNSGEVMLSLPSAFGSNVKVAVNSYRGIEMPFGHIWKFADGIKYLGDGSVQSVLRSTNPANYSSAGSSSNYTSIGNNVGSDGWKTKIMIGSDGDINCKAVGGGSNQAYCDYNKQAHVNGTYYCALLGGMAADTNSKYAGFAEVNSSSVIGTSGNNFGARLCYFEV